MRAQRSLLRTRLETDILIRRVLQLPGELHVRKNERRVVIYRNPDDPEITAAVEGAVAKLATTHPALCIAWRTRLETGSDDLPVEPRPAGHPVRRTIADARSVAEFPSWKISSNVTPLSTPACFFDTTQIPTVSVDPSDRLR